MTNHHDPFKITKEWTTHQNTESPVKKKRGRPKALKTKIKVTIRLDEEIVSGFKATGKGWQTRINKVLHNHLKDQQVHSSTHNTHNI